MVPTGPDNWEESGNSALASPGQGKIQVSEKSRKLFKFSKCMSPYIQLPRVALLSGNDSRTGGFISQPL